MYWNHVLTVLEILLFAVSILQFMPYVDIVHTVLLMLWILIACAYVVTAFVLAWMSTFHKDSLKKNTEHKASHRLEPIEDCIPVLSAVLGLITSVRHLRHSSSLPETTDIAIVYNFLDKHHFVVILIGILGWFVLQIGFALIYERVDRESGCKELSFPETEHPTRVEYFYHSITIGTTFAVSDVDAKTSHIRWLIMLHSILAFIYNTVAVAAVVDMISSGV